jgi:aryl-alcohol dehydrogenase-like predicted oxidoreductase
MQYRQLGSSDLQVSAIALGTWLTTSGGLERAQAIACIRRPLDLAITFIDTANVYGRGASEIVLGEALAGVPRGHCPVQCSVSAGDEEGRHGARGRKRVCPETVGTDAGDRAENRRGV